MRSAVLVEEEGVEVEEATRDSEEPLARVLGISTVLDHEHPELVQTLQSYNQLSHNVIIACLMLVIDDQGFGSQKKKKEKKRRERTTEANVRGGGGESGEGD